MTTRLNFCFTDKQEVRIKQISETTGYNKSDVMRRAVDYALLPPHVDFLFPMCSGQFFAVFVKRNS